MGNPIWEWPMRWIAWQMQATTNCNVRRWNSRQHYGVIWTAELHNGRVLCQQRLRSIWATFMWGHAEDCIARGTPSSLPRTLVKNFLYGIACGFVRDRIQKIGILCKTASKTYRWDVQKSSISFATFSKNWETSISCQTSWKTESCEALRLEFIYSYLFVRDSNVCS